MAATLLAMLVGVGVPYFVARKFAERYLSWVGVAVSLALACAAGVVALFILAFVSGFLLEHYMNLFDIRLDAGAWINDLSEGDLGSVPGSGNGRFSRPTPAAALRAVTELLRMKEFWIEFSIGGQGRPIATSSCARRR